MIREGYSGIKVKAGTCEACVWGKGKHAEGCGASGSLRIQVHGNAQEGNRLCVVASEDAKIWCTTRFQVEGLNVVHPLTGADVGLMRYSAVVRSVDLKAGVPAELEIWPAIILSGQYRNAVGLPVDGAILYSTDSSWPGDRPAWFERMTGLNQGDVEILRRLRGEEQPQAAPHRER
jgi:hypothetical protein